MIQSELLVHRKKKNKKKQYNNSVHTKINTSYYDIYLLGFIFKDFIDLFESEF